MEHLAESTDAVVEIPPAGYIVAEATQEGEGDKPFACPHTSCDGFTFETVQECQIHEDDWHSPPYFCSECDTSFAARPALKRHFKSSGHFNWICLEEKCEMKGILFANQSEFVAHALNTPGHEHLFPDEALQSPVSVKRINYAEVIHLMDYESTEECLSEAEEHICPEPSCHRYQQTFSTEGSFSRHEESYGHTHAIKYSETLRESGKSIADIMTAQEAARELQCTAEGCKYFGEKLKSSQAFYNHIMTAQHLSSPSLCPSNPTSPTADIRLKFSQLNISCDEPECPKYEYRFSSLGNYNKHVQSAAHLQSVKYGHMARSMASSASEGQENLKPQTPEREQPVTIKAPPSTPQIWSRSSFAPISPVSAVSTPVERVQFITPTKRPVPGIALMTPPSWREENLRKRNRELEEELQQMKGKMERLRTAYQEQISSLFQTLGATQDRGWR